MTEPRRRLLAFDFDGVIHRYSKGWAAGDIYDPLDFVGIQLAYERGYASAIVTSRDVVQVAEAVANPLIALGFSLKIDPNCETVFWNGGEDGRMILITNRKLAAYANIDDRGVAHRYGTDWLVTLAHCEKL